MASEPIQFTKDELAMIVKLADGVYVQNTPKSLRVRMSIIRKCVDAVVPPPKEQT